MIEVPANILDILNDEPTDENLIEAPITQILTEELLKRRREAFIEELTAICYDHFRNVEEGDIEEGNSEFDTQSIKDWPDYFDIETVPVLVE